MQAAPMTTMRTSGAAVAALANNKGQQTQQQVSGNNNNNSRLAAMMAQLQLDYNNYKYTVYRCASKFVALQRIFHTSKVPFKLVLAILERHGMPSAGGSGSLNLMVPPFQLTALLHDIYFACEKLGHFTKASGYQLETATALLANFFWNIYDPHRRHSISLLEIKVTFLLLCKLYSSDQLVADFHALLADMPKSSSSSQQSQVHRLSFELLLHTLSKLLGYLGESKAYGAHNVSPMMEQSFARCPSLSAGLTECQFHNLWTQTQTRFLIYANLLSLIKRIEDTQHLIHSNQCAGCRVEHIVGIRFKCQVCRDLSLCLPCFATGQHVPGKHEAAHRMCEVFVEDQPPRRWTQYLARICGWFEGAARQQKEERRGFCNVAHESARERAPANELTAIPAETRSLSASLPLKEEPQPQLREEAKEQQQQLCSLTGLAITASKSSERLQCIIDRLLLQNAKLEVQLQLLATTSSAQISDFLSAHQRFLLQIIEDMRQLSRSSGNAPAIGSSSCLTASTPHRPNLGLIPVSYDASTLSHSINGAELNRSYLEANKSDYSLNDVSLWFDQRRSSSISHSKAHAPPPPLSSLPPLGALLEQSTTLLELTASRDTEMANFKLLLHKVREIVEDSYSDNAELSEATQNLELVLDSIIQSEEQQRRCST